MEYLLINYARRIKARFLRVSLAIILAWIGTLKFVDPSPVVGLLQASLPFLAFNTSVYVLGTEMGLMAAAVNVIALAPVHESRRMAAQAVTA